VAGELAYIEEPGRAGFERTYGWAWLLALAAELAQHATGDGRRWHAALALVDDDPALSVAIREKARAWYLGDRDCEAWEPGGDDFLSPALVEVECMRRVLAADEFAAWLAGFLPRLA